MPNQLIWRSFLRPVRLYKNPRFLSAYDGDFCHAMIRYLYLFLICKQGPKSYNKAALAPHSSRASRAEGFIMLYLHHSATYKSHLSSTPHNPEIELAIAAIIFLYILAVSMSASDRDSFLT